LLSRGKIVSKDEIVRHVWPTTCVEESNLRFQMASLRKVLGAYRDSIKTIPGRGYLLASDLSERDQRED
jgi:DNA-binding winged helix-turn-helix (wHTH) protein